MKQQPLARTRIKICGLTNLEDARCAAEAGADLLGFIFYPSSPRFVTPERAAAIIQAIRREFGDAPRCVGVFVNEPVESVRTLLDSIGLDLAQSWLIGDQTRDISAGRRAGCRTVLITGDATRAREAHATSTVTSFADAVQHILQTTPNGAPTARRVNPSRGADVDDEPSSEGDGSLHRAIIELTDEIRSERLRRVEFTYLRMAAIVTQLLVVLLAVLTWIFRRAEAICVANTERCASSSEL